MTDVQVPDGGAIPAEVDNPFAVPGLTADAPLDPVQIEEHRVPDLYVPVDHTQTEFEKFTRQIGGFDAVRTRGRVVVVTGETNNTGRSALISRCVHHLRVTLARQSCQVVVVDARALVPDGNDEPVQSVPERRQAVIEYVALRVWADGAVTDNELTSRMRDYKDWRSQLKYVAGVMAKRAVTLVLLPPTDLSKELSDYARAAPPRVVFFGELNDEWEAARSRELAKGGQVAEPIHLQLGYVDVADAVRFTETRLKTPRGDHLPTVPETTLRELIRTRPRSIGELQALFYYMYEDFRRKPGSIKEVTIPHIAEYFMRYPYRGPDER